MTYCSKPDVRDVVYCYGFRHNDPSTAEDDLEMILDLYFQQSEERERDRLRDTLSCTRDTDLLEKYVPRNSSLIIMVLI